MDAPLLVASNRGPVEFVTGPDGEPEAKRGSGGLATALASAVQATGGLWVAAAMTDGDRAQALATPNGRTNVATDDGKLRVRLLTVDPQAYQRYYDEVSNRLLWFAHHALWDLSREPVFDRRTKRDWGAYRQTNRVFAEALAQEAEGRPANILVQDYHLALVPAMLRELAPSARIAHFHHVPFASPDRMALLPAWLRVELLEGLLGADLLGFQTARWASAFVSACRLLPGARVDEASRTVEWQDRRVRVGVYPIAGDASALREQASAPEVDAKLRELDAWRGDRALLLRVDRTEPSKNVVRGFLAFEELLRAKPELRDRVAFLALLNPSRRSLAEYRQYTEDCLAAAARIREAFGPDVVDVRVDDDFPEVLAAYRLYDVLLVNPLFDGMNLVAKEGPVVNERNGALILSRNAGAYAELGQHALPVDPLDVAGTAAAIESAMGMSATERARRARALRRIARSGTPSAWVEAQLGDLTAG
ncbi:MAG TPA: trehalose-6-phosphate synthase [Actinomycetota bacterium]|nr:trehalose-6-phosphate synthase [Actinomycetota bacterium]